MTLFEELQRRGLLAQLTDEEEIKNLDLVMGRNASKYKSLDDVIARKTQLSEIVTSTEVELDKIKEARPDVLFIVGDYVDDDTTKTVKCRWVDLFTFATNNRTEVVYCDLSGNEHTVSASEVVSIVPAY